MPHPAFESIHHQTIASLNIELCDYKHPGTGARHIHLSADDSNNVFLVAFPTVPQDSTGVAHILEHTTLCGSQRYPVRDPFFMMIRRSLNTFMNAFTSSDWTAYPFATQNRKDFDNLLGVYLDAVFFPLLNELDFAQEGHRLEFATSDDPNSELVFKGVVFNEMKGAMSSPVSRLAQTLQSQLFPTTTYHFNSGGEPEDIPTLTHTQLKAFHERHYHPSNAIFLTYGDILPEHHQEQFHERALCRFKTRQSDFRVADERRLAAPVQVETSYAVGEDEDPQDKTHIALGWLLGPITDPRAVLEARILTDVLLDNSSSPLRHALETSRLGQAPSPLCGFDDSTREATFMVGLEGSNPQHAQAVEELILGIIGEMAEHGVDQDTLASVLHQLELRQREITGDGYPYGLRLILDVLTPAIHGGPPAAALDLDALLEELREASKAPAFIKALARRLLLDNPHRVRLTMRPEPGLGNRQTKSEAQRLAAIKATLSEAERNRIMQRTRLLQVHQAREDDAEILPRVTLRDVPLELKIPEGRQRRIGDTPTTWFSQATNGMVYQQWVVDLPALDPSLLDLIPLYCLCLTEMGSGGRDYLQTQALQAAVTGGVSARCLVRSGLDDMQRMHGVLTLAGKALKRNQGALAQLLSETFTRVRFDELSRLRELVAQLYAEREEAMTHQGHLLAMTAASAGISPTTALAHRWEGMQGLQTLKALNHAITNATELAALATQLARLHTLLQTASRQLLVITESGQPDAMDAAIGNGLTGLKPLEAASAPLGVALNTTTVRQGWGINTQVNFCAKAYPTVPENHPDAPALQVLGHYLHNGFLHRTIREQGGAYGAGASYRGISGVFRFFSYRDPRLEQTLADFDQALDWLHTANHTQRDLEEAILGTIATIDLPGSPAGEAIGAFFGSLFGRTPTQRREFRHRVLHVTLNDLQRVTSTYFHPERAGISVLANPATLGGQAWCEEIVRL